MKKLEMLDRSFKMFRDRGMEIMSKIPRETMNSKAPSASYVLTTGNFRLPSPVEKWKIQLDMSIDEKIIHRAAMKRCLGEQYFFL